jgi:hypothetical protein
MEVAARDDRQAELRDPGVERVTVEELEAVDELTQLGLRLPRRGCAVAARRFLDGGRMGGDERRPRVARVAERRLEAVRERRQVAQADGEGVRGEPRVGVVVGQLEAREQQQVVDPAGTHGRGLDRTEVGGEVGRVDVRPPVTGGMVGDAEDVEAVASVEIDELGERQGSVAPVRVRVQLAQQWAGSDRHSAIVPPTETAVG